MDFYHDYDGTNELLVVGARERLQACKCVLLAFGDLGYTDPQIPDLRNAIGEYTDYDGTESLRSDIIKILSQSQVVRSDEIIDVSVVSPRGADHFTVNLQLAFGTTSVELPV